MLIVVLGGVRLKIGPAAQRGAARKMVRRVDARMLIRNRGPSGKPTRNDTAFALFVSAFVHPNIRMFFTDFVKQFRRGLKCPEPSGSQTPSARNHGARP